VYEINPSAYWDETMLHPVIELNELLLGVLRTRAAGLAGAPPSAGPAALAPPRLVHELLALWCAADDVALQRLARCPFLLLDAGFGEPGCWEPRVTEGAFLEGGAARRYFASTEGIALVRHALVFARHLARSDRLSARLLLALAPECAERLAAWSLRELEALAELAPTWIHPRWEGQPLVWRQMLEAAVEGPEEALGRVYSRGLQLMAAVW
jgi:hypothetical protein